MPGHSLDSRLDGAVGGKTAAALERAFGMKTVGDMLSHYPRRYALRGELTPISSLPIGEPVTIVAEVRRATERRMQNRKGSILEVVISDGQGDLSLTFFNQSWRIKDLQPGRRGIFAGKVGEYRGAKQLAHPDYELFDDEDAARLNAQAYANLPIPIYPATSTIASWQFTKFVEIVLDGLGDIDDPLPEDVRLRHGLLDARTALDRIHRPDFQDQIEQARETLRWQEAFVLQAALLQQRQFVRALSATKREPGSLLERFDAHLPFPRTPDQVTVGDQVAHDLQGDWPMNRLVQGEVGSGKTLVALRAMLQVAQSGGQSALIAPTEVLAGQHVRSIARMLGPQLAPELMPILLTGQLTAAERRKAALRVASGQARIVVGTHALLSDLDDVRRSRPRRRRRAAPVRSRAARVAARQGVVAARARADGDADPAHGRDDGVRRPRRLDHPDHARGPRRHPDFRRAARREAGLVRPGLGADRRRGRPRPAGLRRVRGDRRRGRDAGRHRRGARRARPPTRTRWGVVQVADLLSRQPGYDGIRVEILHGKMPSDEKDAVMQAFARGDIDVLIATTVVEVGVDVPNASTMAILEADRFGVSQLHQLRGRVGRGGIPGLCLLVTEAPAGTPARARVDAVAATLDGFALAEVDLELRGEGDVLGDAQSGRALVAPPAACRQGRGSHRDGAGCRASACSKRIRR